MKYCKKCGNQMKDESEFCPKCGSSQKSNVDICDNQISKTEQKNQEYSRMSSASNGNNNMTWIVGIVGVLVLGLGVFIGIFDGDVNKIRDQFSMSQSTEKAEITESSDKGEQSKNVISKEQLMAYVEMKDKMDVEIGSVASSVNSYLGKHANFNNPDAEPLINNAKSTLEKVEKAQQELKSKDVSKEDELLKNTIIQVFDCEAGRIRGLYKGMLDSKNNGDYQNGFKDGTAAAYKFDDENAKLKDIINRK